MQLAPDRHPVRTLLGISGLVGIMALGVTLALGTAAVLLLLAVSSLGG